MDDTKKSELLERIQYLESQIADREADLKHYRLEIGQLNQRMEAIIVRLNNELKLMHEIQKLLVPTELPSLQGFEFSSKFVPSIISGGDYFDIFEHNDRLRFGMVVSSATGHSMSALLLSVLLRLTSRMEARTGAKPEQILKSVVEELAAQSIGNDAAHIFYSMMDRRSFTLHYSLLGDISVFYQSAKTKNVELIRAMTPPITSSFSQKVPSKSIQMQPRDRLVLVTQGIAAAVNLNGEEFGVERLADIMIRGPKLSVHELRNSILHEVENHRSGQQLQRDQTILVLEVKERVIKLADISSEE